MSENFRLNIKNLAETARLGRTLAQCAFPGMHLGLSGDLGAGKTELVRQIVAALGGAAGDVASPSFVLECVYRLPAGGAVTGVRHWDWYRLKGPELPDEIFDERLSRAVITVIEWPERCPDWEKLEDVRCHLSISGKESRVAEIQVKNDALAACLKKSL